MKKKEKACKHPKVARHPEGFCNNCGKEIKRIGVLSPTLNKKRQQQCLDCANEQIKSMYVISSKKFKSINDALVQMVKWDKAGTLSKSAHVYEVLHALRVKHKKLPKKKVRKYKGGGYVIEENPEPGITVLEMNGKGWYEEFAKPLLKKKK